MKVDNRQFGRNYEELEDYEAGIALTGAEVKSIKKGNINLERAFVRVLNTEAFLMNAEVPIYKFSRPQNYDPFRQRKLLLHKDQIVRLETKLKSTNRLTVVPKSCYNKGSKIKIRIALVRGRGEIEKKKREMKQDIKRKQEKEMKEFMKR